MSAFRFPIDLSRLGAPQAVETLDYEAIVRAMRDALVAAFPPIAGVIDLASEPARKLIEGFAYREMLLRAMVNDKILAGTVAYATGSDLDHLAANIGIERLVIRPAAPGVAAEMESDERLRRRVTLGPEAFNTAGSEGAYVFHALTAAPTIADASAVKEAPGAVSVTLLGAESPEPSAAELDAVRTRLGRPDVRPLTDVVGVRGPTVIRPAIAARLTLYPGPAAPAVAGEARAKLDAFLNANRRLGFNLPRSAIQAALHVEGVREVDLVSPETSIDVDPTAVVAPASVTVTVAGRDE